MNWINPRAQLPLPDQIIWCIQIKNRSGEKFGDPCAEVFIAKAARDDYGVIFAEKIGVSGHPNHPHNFFSWWHHDQSHVIRGQDPIQRSFCDVLLIDAWMPFSHDDLPHWDYISLEESVQMISKTAEYQKGVQSKREKNRIFISEADKLFIYMSEKKPFSNGLYVVSDLNHIWLCRYNCANQEWIGMDGSEEQNEVIAWYPL